MNDSAADVENLMSGRAARAIPKNRSAPKGRFFFATASRRELGELKAGQKPLRDRLVDEGAARAVFDLDVRSQADGGVERRRPVVEKVKRPDVNRAAG